MVVVKIERCGYWLWRKTIYVCQWLRLSFINPYLSYTTGLRKLRSLRSQKGAKGALVKIEYCWAPFGSLISVKNVCFFSGSLFSVFHYWKEPKSNPITLRKFSTSFWYSNNFCLLLKSWCNRNEERNIGLIQHFSSTKNNEKLYFEV